MKKTSLLFIAACFSFSGFAQRSTTTVATPVHSIHTNNAAARTTSAGDTRTLTNIAPFDPLVVISYSDSGTYGYVAGTNSYNDKAFAERYYFNGADSSMKVTGVVAQFGGTINPASTKSINFRVWNMGAPKTATGTMKYEGFPKDIINTLAVPVTQLGISSTAASDTMKSFTFAAPSPTLNGAFFIGYDISYDAHALAGDTLGLASSANGHRTMPAYHLAYTIFDEDTVHIDTILHVQNATQYADNNWHENYTDNDSILNNLAIFPIVLIGNPTEVNSIVKDGLSLFGCFPNPATNSTNIKFALAQSADVTIKVMDMTGRLLSTTTQTLTTGTHNITIPTNELPAGNYIYTIQTAGNNGIASQLTVIK